MQAEQVQARQLLAQRGDAVILDLQDRADRARLQEPELFFEAHRHQLVCLDEIQLLPEFFSLLRAEIDRDRWPGRFLLLGSASGPLLSQSHESMAGRIAQELTPFLLKEVAQAASWQQQWLRGGPGEPAGGSRRGQHRLARGLHPHLSGQRHRLTGAGSAPAADGAPVATPGPQPGPDPQYQPAGGPTSCAPATAPSSTWCWSEAGSGGSTRSSCPRRRGCPGASMSWWDSCNRSEPS